ncbi:conserved hypothetical protein [Shewanella woodyi ATCC 51908]|uniref:DUF4272 domain-containing protein n=2 Tax=Shewanella woodyi TaxID=60961 RepID=B1KRN6_SHEWM|nr:conserved hypothetical protein [Shewanella woodyi ATCC 51908]
MIMNLRTLKIQNESKLLSEGIVVNPNLPIIEELSEVSPRIASDVASRICAMSYVVGLAFDAVPEHLIQNLKQYSLWGFVTEQEQELLLLEQIPKEEFNELTWMPESIQALVWSLGLIGMDHHMYCDDKLASIVPPYCDPAGFIKNAELKPITQIQEQCDLLYRLHWYSKHCRINGIECLYDESIISERRKALDWVYGVTVNWDDIPMDT